MITFNEFANFKSVESYFSPLLLWNMKKSKKEIFFFFQALHFSTFSFYLFIYF